MSNANRREASTDVSGNQGRQSKRVKHKTEDHFAFSWLVFRTGPTTENVSVIGRASGGRGPRAGLPLSQFSLDYYRCWAVKFNTELNSSDAQSGLPLGVPRKTGL